MSRQAPSPRSRFPLIGNLLHLHQDVLGLMMKTFRECGGVGRVRLGPLQVYLVSDPDAIKQVLKDGDTFDKQTRTSQMIGRLTGESLLISNGETWARQRRLMQPLFAPANLRTYLPIMEQEADRLVTDLRQTAGQPVDLAAAMMRVTYRIVERSLFRTAEPEDMERLGEAIGVVLEDIYRRIESPLQVPGWIPTPGQLAYRDAMQQLNARVDTIIDQHLAQPEDDLLGHLMQAGGGSLSRQELRNETITLLIAGHETTANAMVWLLYQLCDLPEIVQRVREDDDEPYLRMVLQESLRLYPPIWAIVRRVTQETELGSYRIPAEARIVISPYVVHRDPAHWAQPKEFRPQRFTPDSLAERHHYAYLPFGGGPRLCIGHAYALMEMQVLTRNLLRAFDLRLAPEARIEPHPGIALRARHGLPMILTPR